MDNRTLTWPCKALENEMKTGSIFILEQCDKQIKNVSIKIICDTLKRTQCKQQPRLCVCGMHRNVVAQN